MTDYYRPSTSTGTLTVTAACSEGCINGEKWTCDDHGQLVDSGKKCAPEINPLMVAGVVATVAVVGAVLLVGNTKGKKG